jgi:hypothetical protein
MRRARAIVISAILALGMAGSILAASAAPGVVSQASSVHSVAKHHHVSYMYYYE